MVTLTFADGEKALQIDEAAFRECTALSKITFPKNLTNIGPQAFGPQTDNVSNKNESI